MRLVLEAAPGELEAKGQTLLDALAKALAPSNPELAAALSSAALPPSDPGENLPPALQEMRQAILRRYARTLDGMSSEIAALLEKRTS